MPNFQIIIPGGGGGRPPRDRVRRPDPPPPSTWCGKRRCPPPTWCGKPKCPTQDTKKPVPPPTWCGKPKCPTPPVVKRAGSDPASARRSHDRSGLCACRLHGQFPAGESWRDDAAALQDKSPGQQLHRDDGARLLSAGDEQSAGLRRPADLRHAVPAGAGGRAAVPGQYPAGSGGHAAGTEDRCAAGQDHEGDPGRAPYPGGESGLQLSDLWTAARSRRTRIIRRSRPPPATPVVDIPGL